MVVMTDLYINTIFTILRSVYFLFSSVFAAQLNV